MRNIFRQLMMSSFSKQDWENKPADWSDIRKDCPANSIALYAAHKSDYTTEGYQQIGNVPYTLVGNPTITNGVMSGFSTTEGSEAYATIEEAPTETVKSFRIKVKFTTGSTLPSAGQEFYLFGQKNSNNDTPQLYIDGNNGRLHYSHPLGSSWGNYAESSSFISANTTYWAIVEWVNNKSTVYLSTDGANYSAGSSSSNSSISWTGKIAIGADYDTDAQKISYAFNGGSIDLNETSIEVNSKGWFKYGGKITAVNNNDLFLQSSGTQYIDTGVVIDDNNTLDITFDVANDGVPTICGGYSSDDSSQWLSNSATLRTSPSEVSVLKSNAKVYLTVGAGSHRLIISPDNVTFDGTTYSWLSDSGNGTKGTISLFVSYYSGSRRFGSISIKRAKIYDGDNVLVRDLIPVPAGLTVGNFTVVENGMWDLVNQEFYGNRGSGTFVYGGGANEYDNLGFTATCVGGYKVYIDGNVYGSYASGSQCSITWSTSGITTGDDITTPTALKAHKIWIEPATEGDNITVFKMTDRAGLLWLHSNVETVFANINNFVGSTSGSSLIKAVTAKNNVLKAKQMSQAFGKCSDLEYLPILDFDNSAYAQPYMFYGLNSYTLKKVTLKNLQQTGNVSNADVFDSCYGLETIKTINSSICWYVGLLSTKLYSLKKLPDGLYNSTGSVRMLYASSLNPTDLDFRDRTAATYIRINGDATHPAYGIKSLRVSNQAPFTDTAPQIDVSYTGLDRAALVQLFNDLPYNVGYEVVGSPTITNGIVTDISENNRIYTSKAFPTDFDEIEMIFKVSDESEIPGISVCAFGTYNDYKRIFADKYRIDLRDSSNTIIIEIPSSEFNVQNYAASGFYIQLKVKKQINNYLYTLSASTDKETWVSSNATYSEDICGGNTVWFLSSRSGTYNGIPKMDFNNSSINLNGIPWFKGQPAMNKTLSCVGATGNQLSIVGSPTIVDGVASGFSDSNYLTISGTPYGTSNNVEIRIKFTPTEITQGYLMGLSPTSAGAGIYLTVINNVLRYGLATKGLTQTTAGSAYAIQELNVPYYLHYAFDVSTLNVKMGLSSDGINPTYGIDITATQYPEITQLLFGKTLAANNFYLRGSIDLNETYIKVNGETWFDINNCLLPENKDIALNKGWQLTLS